MSGKRKKSIAAGKEHAFVIAGLIFAFILLMSLVMLLSVSIISVVNSNMYMRAEQTFTSALMLLSSDDPSRVIQVLTDEGVRGVGVYSSQGTLLLGAGNIPNTMDVETAKSEQRDSRQPSFRYNTETGLIEYHRFARDRVAVSLSMTLPTTNNQSQTVGANASGALPWLLPEVIYIVFDGTNYHKQLTMIRTFSFFAIVAIVAFFLLVLNIYRNNRQYRMTIQKQESLVNLGEAARTLTHEIKNPLSAITIQVALLKKTLPSNYTEELQVVDQEVQRLIQLTNKVSDFLRNPLGTPETIELHTFIESLTRRFDAPVTFVAESLTRAYVEFDTDRARSVFENLLKNAMESTADGRNPQVEVEIRDGKKHKIHIFVRDRGDGIPSGEEKKIFDPFFTTKIHGSGIGLSICRQFVQAQNGSLKLYPRDGGGTVAEVILEKSFRRPNKEQQI